MWEMMFALTGILVVGLGGFALYSSEAVMGIENWLGTLLVGTTLCCAAAGFVVWARLAVTEIGNKPS